MQKEITDINQGITRDFSKSLERSISDSHPSAEQPFTITLNTRVQADYTAIYQTLYPYAFFHARRYVSPEDASDIIAIVFLKLWSLPNPEFANLTHVKGFLKVCIKNACLTHIRSEQNRMKKAEAWGELFEMEQFAKGSGAEDVEYGIHAEKLQRVYEEIENLPLRCRRIFKMAYIERIKNKEIALLLGIAENTVKSQKKQGLKKLRMALVTVFIFIFYFF